MRLKVNNMRNIVIRMWLMMMFMLVCVLVGAKPVQAYDEYAFLYVDGTYMIRDGELLTNTVKGEKGTAIYDEKKNTLTLNNFTTAPGSTTGIALQFVPNLKIVLKGTNTLNVSVEGIHMGIPKEENDVLTICGGGTLNIWAGSWQKEAAGIIIGDASLMIEGCTVNVSASYGAFSVIKDLTVKDSNLTVKRTGYGKMNDPEQNNNLYNTRYGFPAITVCGNMVVENSTVDATGINYGIALDKVPTLKGKVSITDENGKALNLVKLHWPAAVRSGDTTSFDYAYSTSTDEDVYSFEQTPNRVIIKAQKEANKPVGNGIESNGIIDIGKGEKYWTVNNAYYVGKASTGKVAYAGPVNKNTTKITIPPTVNVDGKVCKVTSIQKSACKDCKKLRTVTIGKNVTTIGTKAFYNCKKLKTVTFGNKVKTIKKEAFANCTKLSSVTIKGKNLKTVGTNAFKNTKKKIKITVPKSKYKNYKKLLKSKGLKSPVYKKK